MDSSGRPCATNVTKFALASTKADGPHGAQLVYYGRGGGTGRWDHVRGGAFGVGLSHNIEDAYTYLISEYRPGDELFLVGFSRGAYTVRSLAGLIRNSGILKPEHRDRLPDAYRLYRRRDPASHPRGTEAQLFRRTHSYETDDFTTRIKFIGAWDAVGYRPRNLSASGLV
jgi:uncharacterized protein (DUF2235 family)